MKKNQYGFSSVEGLIILAIVGLVGFTGWFVYQAKQKSDSAYITSSQESQKTNAASLNAQQQTAAPVTNNTPSNPTAPSTTTFDIESFYAKVQNGMTTKQVEDLAVGKSGDCGGTGTVGAGTFCVWKDGSKSINVNFSASGAVTSKSKSGF